MDNEIIALCICMVLLTVGQTWIMYVMHRHNEAIEEIQTVIMKYGLHEYK